MTSPYPTPPPGKGALYGKQLEPWYLAKLGYEAGWQDAHLLIISVAVCLAESQGYTYAIHHNPPTDAHPSGTFDRGIWQLNTVHSDITDDIAYDPVLATDKAFKLYEARGDFGDWNAYTHGVYLHDSYAARAARGVGNYLASTLLDAPTKDDYSHTLSARGLLDFGFRLADAEQHISTARHSLAHGSTRATVQTVLARAQMSRTKPVPH